MQASAQFDDTYPLRPQVGKPWFGSGKEPTGLQRDVEAAEAAAAAAAVAAAPGCTPSSTTRTTGRCAPATCSPRTTRAGERWEKEGKRAGKLVFSETITEYRDEQRRAGRHRARASACAPRRWSGS